jgi:hypothetical protein
MFEQATEVGVVARTRTRGAAKVRGGRAAEKHLLDHKPQRRIVDLAREVLEKALQLLHGAVCGRQELGRLVLVAFQSPHVVELGLKVAAKSLRAPADPNRVSRLKPGPHPIDLTKHPRRDRARAVAQLQSQIGRAVARGEPVLPHAREAPLEALPGAQLGDRGAAVCGRGFHALDLAFRAGREGRFSKLVL